MQQARPIYPFESVPEGAAAGSSGRSAGIPIREIEATPREKKKDKAKEWGYREEKKRFPLGLLLAVIIVAVGLVGMVTFVVVQEFLGDSPSTPSTPSVPTSTDTTPPEISEIDFSSFSGSSATITWYTDEKASSQVMICDPEGTCSWTDLDKTMVKEHSVTLSNLQPDVDYHITIKSVDNSGNEATSEIDKTFSTSGTTIDTEPPLISDVLPTNVTESSATITWKTNENATSQVEYGTTSAYGTKTTTTTTMTKTHSVKLSDLNGNTTYHFRVTSKDSSDNSARSIVDQTFTTLAPIPVGSEVGNRAPDFTLEDLSGTSITLSDLQGKIVMVNFWATWCNPCKEELPYFDLVYNNWTGDMEMLIVNLKEDGAVVEAFINDYEYSFPVLLDGTGSVADSYPVNSSLDIPRTFFIDADGIIKHSKRGKFASVSEIETILDDM
jgi:peroxiredoxin